MNNKITNILAKNTGIMCPIRKLNHYHLLSRVLDKNIDGDIVECGCFVGNSTQILAAVLEDCGVDKTLYLYDSFSGLPEFHENDQPHTTVHKRGDFATTQDILINNLSIFNIKKQIFAGWFNETIPTNLPNKICYAHLDGDLYDSIKIPLEHIYPRLVSGAICVIDDYDYNQFPGAKQATNEFLADKKEKLNTFCIKPTFSNVYHAYFQKL